MTVFWSMSPVSNNACIKFTASDRLQHICSLWPSLMLYPQSLTPYCIMSAVSDNFLYHIDCLSLSFVSCPESGTVSCCVAAVLDTEYSQKFMCGLFVMSRATFEAPQIQKVEDHWLRLATIVFQLHILLYWTTVYCYDKIPAEWKRFVSHKWVLEPFPL